MPGFYGFAPALVFAAALLSGCGLKGPLELPEQPSNIVIRPAPGTTPAPPSTDGASPAPATPSSGATTPATPVPEEPEERLPPPELPRGQRGGVS